MTSISTRVCDFMTDESEPAWLRIGSTILPVIIISYITYRMNRTISALFFLIYLYLVRPIFCRFNTSRYVKRWTVVTGATDGIGRGYTMELARRGLRRFLLIGRNPEKLASVKKELESMYENCEIRLEVFDFFDGDFAKLRAVLADVDIGLAVNSVGVGRELLERYGDSPEVDSEVLRVNGYGAAEFLSCILPPMERHGGGQIVVLSSSQGLHPIPFLASYSATKSLMCFLCECINREYDTINVQCLTPALIATKMTYYNKSSFFIMSVENFARQAVSVLGAVDQTSGCINHEFQMLLDHLLPWAVLRHLIKPIYWLHGRRLIKLRQSDAARTSAMTTKPTSLTDVGPLLDNNTTTMKCDDKDNNSNNVIAETETLPTICNSASSGNLRRIGSKIPTNPILRHRG